MSALLRFDVHRSAYPRSAIGALLATIEAPTHRAAKRAAELTYLGLEVVVLPHRKPNEKLERASARLHARPAKTRPDRAPTNSRRTIPLRSDRP